MVEVKIVLVGSPGIGAKSSLVQYLVEGHCVEGYDPTVEESYRKQLVVDGKACILDILGLFSFFLFPKEVLLLHELC